MTAPGLPEHEREAWDEILTGLRDDPDLGAHARAAQSPRETPPAVDTAAVDEESADTEHDDFVGEAWDDDEAGYEPEPPPPLPRPQDTVARFSWAAVAAGPALVVLASALGWQRWIANLGVVLAVGGFVSLVVRMKDRDEDDDDNGAVV